MTKPKGFSFATMMVLAQRRHAARLASVQAAPPDPVRHGQAARISTQKTKGTKRLLTFMYAV